MANELDHLIFGESGDRAGRTRDAELLADRLPFVAVQKMALSSSVMGWMSPYRMMLFFSMVRSSGVKSGKMRYGCARLRIVSSSNRVFRFALSRSNVRGSAARAAPAWTRRGLVCIPSAAAVGEGEGVGRLAPHGRTFEPGSTCGNDVGPLQPTADKIFWPNPLFPPFALPCQQGRNLRKNSRARPFPDFMMFGYKELCFGGNCGDFPSPVLTHFRPAPRPIPPRSHRSHRLGVDDVNGCPANDDEAGLNRADAHLLRCSDPGPGRSPANPADASRRGSLQAGSRAR